MKSLNAILSVAAAFFLAAAVSCGQDAFNVAERAITVDVPNRLFNSSTAVDGTAGPGINVVSVTVTVKSGGVETPYTATLNSTDRETGLLYSRLSVTVSGQLVSVKGQCTQGGTLVVEAAATAAEDADVSRYSGYTSFPDLTAFKLDWAPSDFPAGFLRVLPCPRPNANLVWDSGVPEAGYVSRTDLGPYLAYGQVAVQLVADEYVGDESLSYDLYYAIADENPSRYTTANYANTYLNYPWTAQWSYAEATGGAAKRISAASYTMARFGSAGHVAGKPDANNRIAVLMDFNNLIAQPRGHWLLVCAVMTRAGISVPSDVFCVPII
jgi:hypothetical protein